MSSLLRTCGLLSNTRRCVLVLSRRDFGASAVLTAKANANNVDPIQKLFLEKLQDYKVKNKGGKLINEDKALNTKFTEEVEQLKKRFGGGNIEEFPQFTFEDQPTNPGTDYDVVQSLVKDKEEKLAKQREQEQ